MGPGFESQRDHKKKQAFSLLFLFQSIYRASQKNLDVSNILVPVSCLPKSKNHIDTKKTALCASYLVNYKTLIRCTWYLVHCTWYLVHGTSYFLKLLNHQVTVVNHITVILQRNLSLLKFTKSRHALELALRNQCLPLWGKELRRDDIHPVQEEI